MSDGMAFLFYKAIKDLGIMIPQDISIVDFNNDLELCAFLELTTVEQFTFDIGKKAMQFLIDRI